MIETARLFFRHPVHRLVTRLLFAAWLGVAAWAMPAWAGDRVALVIGNSAYPSVPLDNPRNDANAMADLLTRAGFTVDKQLDADLGQMQAAVDHFGAAIKNPEVKLGLFYYAGHGLQQDWRNYIVPVSAHIRSSADIPKQTVDISNLLRYMQQAQGRSFLVILDACRDDPFAGTFRPALKGLSQFDAPVGSLLAYATAPGNVAEDGNDKNGLYTGFLLKEFSVPGVKLEDAFKRVRLGVRLASHGAQIPWESTSLEEDLYLMPQPVHKLTDAEKDQLLEREMTYWLRVKSTQDPQELAGFIREFPSGSASELAQSRMNRLLAAMAARETARIAEAARQKAAEALAVREAEAKQRAEDAERQRLAAERAEAERVRLAQLEAQRQEALRLQAEQAAAQRLADEQAAQEQARRAEQALARAAAEKLQAQQLAQEQAEARRLAELARQTQLQLQQAKAEAERLAGLEAERKEAERQQALRAEQEQAALRQAADQAREAAQRLAAEQAKALAATTATAATAATVIASAAPAPSGIAPSTLAPTPFFKGYDEHQRHYSVGDEYQIRVLDGYTGASKPLVMKVTDVDEAAERVTYNDGEFISDLMGNITTNRRGSMSTPRQFYPADLFVGKRWSTRFKQTRSNGTVFTFNYDLKVVAREKITVPAGTFDTYKIEARGFNIELGARLERNIWVAPGINNDIVHEIYVQLRNGRVEQNDRQELVAFSQHRQ